MEYSKHRVTRLCIYRIAAYTTNVAPRTHLPIDNLTSMCEHRLSRIFAYFFPAPEGSSCSEFSCTGRSARQGRTGMTGCLAAGRDGHVHA